MSPESLDAWGSANIPTASCFCYSSLQIALSISFSFNFFAALSSFSVSSQFWLLIFIKCIVDFIIGDNITIYCLSELNNRCTVTSHWPWRRNNGPWSWCTSITYIVICGLQLVVKLALYAITHSLYAIVDEIWTMLLRNWWCLTKPW